MLADPLTGVPAGVLTIVTVGTVKLQNAVNQNNGINYQHVTVPLQSMPML